MPHEYFDTAPHFRPYRWAGTEFQVGLQPIRAEDWLMVDAGYAGIMRQKRAHVSAAPEHFYRTLPGSLAAQRELRDLVFRYLAARPQGDFELDGDIFRCGIDGTSCELGDESTEPLWQLSRFVQEDFMLLEQSAAGMAITAAANAYSSSGRLVASVGHAMPWAHQPVPNLTTVHGARIERILASVHESAMAARYNWMLTPVATLYFPPNPHAANRAALEAVSEKLAADPASAPEVLWIRVERQTLRRLPRSRAIAFGIHTYSDPLNSLLDDRESLQALLHLLKGYSPERLAYSDMQSIQTPVITWLESTLAARR